MADLLMIKNCFCSVTYGRCLESIPKAKWTTFRGVIDDFLTKPVTGNKPGALLLTIYRLTTGAANERFTIRLAIGAVRDGNGKIGKARLKHPTFNRIRVLP
jgi:hypothetical protein